MRILSWALGLSLLARPQGPVGTLEISVRENGAPVACRIHLQDPNGGPVKASAYPSWNDHFICDGLAKLDLPPGPYRIEVEKGPEHSVHAEEVSVVAGDVKKVVVEIKRLLRMSSEGWWSGELHVHRPLKDIELLMRAEDLHVAPVITWWNDTDLWSGKELPPLLVKFDEDRFYHVMGGEDEREGGALLYFDLPRPLAIRGSSREYPSPVKFLEEARRTPGAHVDIEKPFWWDVPVWLATGQVDTMGIAVNHMYRSGMMPTSAWGRPRPTDRLPPPMGIGHWVQEIYYHALSCGLRIAPSAGSASGVLPNPVGYNRAYVHIEGAPTYEKWMEGLRAGRSVITNGPLLRVRANGELPGHVFRAEKEISIDLTALLDGRDPIASVEIVRDGRIERTVPAKEGLGRLEFASSGWFLVRCLSPNPKTFRFASTAPFYVEIGASKRRISKASARFFLDWVEERIPRVKLKLTDPKQLEEVLEPHERAIRFWSKLIREANAD